MAASSSSPSPYSNDSCVGCVKRGCSRPCFARALKEAHRRARQAARVAAIPAEIKTARLAELQSARERVAYVESFRQSQARIAEIDRELSTLAA